MSTREAFGREAQRYLDGEPFGDLPDAERSRADRLAEAARALGGSLPALEASLDARVMAAVRQRAAAPRRTAWRWVVEPRAVRIRPVWIPLAAAAALALWWVVPGPRGAGAPVAPMAVAASMVHDTVYVRFEMADPSAKAVAVAGSFNGWRADALQMKRGGDGVWSVTVPLPLGEYHYQFVVDGQRWVSDPTAHALEDDGFGGRNSVIVVGPKGVVRS